MTTVMLKVIMPRPDGVTSTELREYVITALAQWAKGGDPADPLFSLNRRDITCAVMEVHHAKD